MKTFMLINIAQAGVITDAKPVSGILMNVLNFLLSVVGIVGIIGLVVAGIMYLSAAGDEKQMRTAKLIVIASVIGLVLALGALVIVTELSRFLA